ncbi:MAG: ABC transporter ATP-binding protein [Deltaproteobacteria bacterium]|nr:ABC transporter ATP-binding protein [Deltaproteobacteria bacterium]
MTVAGGARLELVGVTRTYQRGDVEVPVLHGIDLTIAAGERIAIMGRSGSGKSTLLNILGCLDQPTTGEYRVGDADTSKLDDKALSSLRCASIGFVFQSFHLLSSMSVVENVGLPMEYAQVPPAAQRTRAIELLEMVGLGHRLEHRPNELSGGERQRVAIARALANRPQLLLADEPTGALDSKAQETILALFALVHERFGTTMVVVTHDEKVAHTLGDRVLRMSDGRFAS